MHTRVSATTWESTTCRTIEVRLVVALCHVSRVDVSRRRSQRHPSSSSSYFLPFALAAAGAAAAAFFLGAFLLLRGPAPFSFFAVVAFTAGLV